MNQEPLDKFKRVKAGWRRWWPVMISVSLVTILSCQTTPVGRRQLALVPSHQMSLMGAEAFANLKETMEIEDDPTLLTYINCVSSALIKNVEGTTDWEVVLFREDSANAFALPGGKIGVHTGMLEVAENQHQLAAVLGHEIAHVISNHANERISENFVVEGGLAIVAATLRNRESPSYKLLMAALGLGAQFGIILPHNRRQETEADVIGLDLMATAGFEPKQSLKLWANMAEKGGAGIPEFLSTHPSHGTRSQTLERNMPRALQLYEAAVTRPTCAPNDSGSQTN